MNKVLTICVSQVYFVKMKNQLKIVIKILFIILSVAGCAATKQEKPIDIHPIVSEMLTTYGYNGCYLMGLPEIISFSLPEKETVTVSDNEIQRVICNPADYAKKMPLNHSGIEEGDFVKVDLDVIYLDGTKKEIRDQILDVGSGNYSLWLERQTVGLSEKDIKEIKINDIDRSLIKEDVFKNILEITIVVNEAYSLVIPELNDEFVRSNIGYDSYDEYYHLGSNIFLQ